MNQKRKLSERAINWDHIKRILLIRLRSMGDIILMTPVISSLKQLKPDISISVLIEKRFEALLEGNPQVDALIFDKTGKKGKRSLADNKLLLRDLSAQNFDLVINLHGGTRSTLQTLASRAPYRAAPQYFHYGYVYNIKTAPPNTAWHTEEPLHTVQNQLSLLKSLNIPMLDYELSVSCDYDIQEEVKKDLMSLGIDSNKPYIIIHPGASLESKRWQADKFAQLSDWLITTHKLPVLLIADSQQEEEIVNDISNKSQDPPFSWVGPQLNQLIAIIKCCSLYIGNDAGPTHLAAAFKKPIVVIFGSSDHTQWHPWRTHYSLIRHDLPCNPCPGKKCNHTPLYECVQSITLEEVQKGVMEQISNIRS